MQRQWLTACRCSPRFGGCPTLWLSYPQTSLGEHTRLRSAGLSTKQHSWKEKASAPKRLQSTNMAFEKNISAIFFSTDLHFSIPEAVLRIYNWPPRVPIEKVIEVRPPKSNMFKVSKLSMSFFWKTFILLNRTNKF